MEPPKPVPGPGENSSDYVPNLRLKSGELIAIREMAIKLTLGAIAAAYAVPEIKAILAGSGNPFRLLQLTLLSLTGLLVFIWIEGVGKELDQLFDWLDATEFEPPRDLREKMTALLFVALLVGLMIASKNPLHYSAVFSAYRIVLFLSHRPKMELEEMLETSRRRALRAAQNHPADARMKIYIEAIDVLAYFHLGKPYRIHGGCTLLISLAAMGFAVRGMNNPLEFSNAIAYGLLILALGASEGLMTKWRFERDSALRSLRQKLAGL